jgi:branched-chain amino acid transport system substrate-binding protein
MKINRPVTVLVPMIALAVLALSACGKKDQVAADGSTIIKIGHVAPLTGSIAHLGKDNENGARLKKSTSRV